MDVNRCTILGRLGRDPEVRHTQSGDAVATLSVATGQQWKDKATGEIKKKTEWHKVVVWGKAAEFCERLAKGARVLVEGPLETRAWQDKAGVEKYTTEIIVRGPGTQLIALDPVGDGARGGGAQPTGHAKNDLDDEIPFATVEEMCTVATRPWCLGG